MYKIICDYCFETSIFERLDAKPAQCKNCNSPLGHLKAELMDAKTTGLIFDDPDIALCLTYQKTGERIIIPYSDTIILGRQSTGKSLFEKIPQISREHCKIEFIGGQYLVTDLNSLNGTFVGSLRRDCLKHQKELLIDNDVLYLGREPFMVNINPDAAHTKNAESQKAATEDFEPLSFKCKACGKVHAMNLMICDECGSYGQIEPLTD
jgi:hypothetical protein